MHFPTRHATRPRRGLIDGISMRQSLNIGFAQGARRRFAALAALLSFASAAAAGCGSTKEKESPCEDSSCLPGQRCTQGECRPTCASQDDCPKGQNCALYEFGDGSRGQYCVVLDYAKNGRTGQLEACQADGECDTPRGFKCVDALCQRRTGQFEACEDDAQCDQPNGFSCVSGECRVPCASHFDCAPVGTCESTSQGMYCKAGTLSKRGQYYARCPYGNSDCDTTKGFTCIGSGVADLDAFCTAACSSADDCPSGFRCGAVGATPCANTCGVTGQQVEGCIPASDIGPGKAYECGQPFGLIRRVCVRNAFCTTCRTDEDCFGISGQICAKDKSGQKICTFPCTPGIASCPWGAATECGVWDKERGVATCAHRFGACHGTGKGCEPCVDNIDCGKNGYCQRSSFTGERFCVDLSTSCNCGSDADANGSCEGHGCPESPGGLAMTCADTSLGQLCLGAQSGDSIGSVQTGCWAPP